MSLASAESAASLARAEKERDFYRKLLDLGQADEIEPFLADALALIVEISAAVRGYVELRRWGWSTWQTGAHPLRGGGGSSPFAGGRISDLPRNQGTVDEAQAPSIGSAGAFHRRPATGRA